MIISRTPFRISFFGGGTDYPQWIKEHGGAVLTTSIDKFCYISIRTLPPFFEHKYRIVYSIVENAKKIDDIQHPSVRTTVKWSGLKRGLEIHHDGDLPARSGLGSSSSFTVGMVNALNGLAGKISSQDELAKVALHLEQDVMKEAVGCQDQIQASCGGFNKIVFHKDGSFNIHPIVANENSLKRLQKHLLLFYTGVSRLSTKIAESKIANFKNRVDELKNIHSMVDRATGILLDPDSSIIEFGKLLHESWLNKRRLSDKVTNQEIDDIYNTGRKAGAVGGKILGAGGGGFILFFAEPSNHDKITKALKRLIHVPFDFERSGSRIVLYQPNGL